MTSFQRDALLSGWPSFPRKRESISVSESRNSRYYVDVGVELGQEERTIAAFRGTIAAFAVERA